MTIEDVPSVTDFWLKQLCPGALLYSRQFPTNLHLVYHAEVKEFPGPWYQIKVWLVESAQPRLVQFDMSLYEFRERWAIVDVDT